jgi:hypothetical protein
LKNGSIDTREGTSSKTLNRKNTKDMVESSPHIDAAMLEKSGPETPPPPPPPENKSMQDGETNVHQEQEQDSLSLHSHENVSCVNDEERVVADSQMELEGPPCSTTDAPLKNTVGMKVGTAVNVYDDQEEEETDEDEEYMVAEGGLSPVFAPVVMTRSQKLQQQQNQDLMRSERSGNVIVDVDCDGPDGVDVDRNDVKENEGGEGGEKKKNDFEEEEQNDDDDNDDDDDDGGSDTVDEYQDLSLLTQKPQVGSPKEQISPLFTSPPTIYTAATREKDSDDSDSNSQGKENSVDRKEASKRSFRGPLPTTISKTIASTKAASDSKPQLLSLDHRQKTLSNPQHKTKPGPLSRDTTPVYPDQLSQPAQRSLSLRDLASSFSLPGLSSAVSSSASSSNIIQFGSSARSIGGFSDLFGSGGTGSRGSSQFKPGQTVPGRLSGGFTANASETESDSGSSGSGSESDSENSSDSDSGSSEEENANSKIKFVGERKKKRRRRSGLSQLAKDLK